ncbi:response regulator [Terricaulis sp.]|uniref:response regulator n=1 Tax=Terricaulis sp. TaxID=2768686 RepID=UPI003784C4DA
MIDRPVNERANILLVDDQAPKLMSYELILAELGENLLKATSAKEALEVLLKTDVAVILIDVCMPELDGFELAQMIREHPRFEQTAIIFISAIHLSELDSLKGYEMGAVDYVPVPVAPHVLRAKVRVFVDLYRKTRQLARLNNELEERVAQRTAELEAATVRQELLAREVDHRARNALAVIQAIVSMTPQSSPKDFARAVDGRIRAMARAHTLLSQTRWQGADLMRLMSEEMEPFHADERVEISGPAVMIKPTVAQNLALAIHELATNAAKYGALSLAQGRLSVSWSMDADALVLNWVEQGGPPVSKPVKTGFGSKVVASSVKALDGDLDYDWRKSGLQARLRLSADHFSPPENHVTPRAALVRDDVLATSAGSPIIGRRILVVEDEPLVAMMMKQLLSDLGAEAVGPCSTLTEAFAGLEQDFDAAVLDVNVAGELIYPFADELGRRRVPMVFLTGYESASIEPRFADAPILTKPIEPAELLEALAGALTTSDRKAAFAG